MKKTLLTGLIFCICGLLSAQQYRLVNPKDSIITASTTLNFQWSIVDNATGYELEVATDPTFTPTLGGIVQPVGLNTSVQETSITGIGTYYWRIRANTAQGFLPYSYSRTFTIFSPTQFPGLSMWFDASRNVTQTGGNISEWDDLSATALTATQSNAIYKPTLISSTPLCGKPVVHFTGEPTGASTSFLNFAAQTYGDMTAFMLRSFVHNSSPNNYLQFILGGPSGGIGAEANYYTAGYGFYSPTGSGPGLFFSTSGAEVPGFGVYTSELTDNGQTGHIYRNGIAPPMSSTQQLAGLTLNQMGLRSTSAGLAYSGDVAEIVLYSNAMADADRALVEAYLRYKFAPPVNLGPDTIYNQFCVNLTLGPVNACYSSYLWSTGESTATIHPTALGTYWVRVTDNLGFVSSDTMSIRPQLAFNQLPDTVTVCAGTTVTWNTGYPQTGFQFTWSTGASTPSITIDSSGYYYVKIKDGLNCYLYSDTILVTIDPFPNHGLGPDTSLCSGNRLNFMYPDTQLHYIYWSTGDSMTTEPVINTAGTYSVIAENLNGCIAKDTIVITIKGIAPTVDFSAPILCASDTVLFTNLSAPPPGHTITGWLWNFGDDSTSALQNPTHIFAGPGQYNVSLTATTDSGCTNGAHQNLNAYLKPTALFQAKISCAQAETNFVDLSMSNSSAIDSLWKWHFSSVDTSVLRNPTFSFPSPGKYGVSLKVTTSDGCSDVAFDTVEVFAPLSANFNIENVCLSDSTTFTDKTESFSIVSWFWDAGDAFFSNKKKFKHKYTAAGTYTVTLRVENAIGCIDTTSRTVTIYNPPVAAFSDMVICDNQVYTPLDSSIVYETNNTWKWNIAGTPYNGLAPQHFFGDTGIYTVKLWVTSQSGCKDSTIRSVHVTPTPVAGFSFTPIYGDAPLTATFHNESVGAASYLWSFGDGFTDTQSDPDHTYATNNTYQIQLTAISEFGCRDSIRKSITVIHTDLDIAITYVETTEAPQTDGTVLVTVIAHVSNVGTRLITSARLYATIGSGGVISEDWIDTLGSGDTKIYTFSGHFVVAAANANTYVCVQAVLVNNGEQETRLDNNQACNSLNGILQIIGPSPNPARGTAYMGLIMPKAGKVWIDIVDVIGQIVMPEIELDLPVGRTDYDIPVKMLRYGEYFIRIRHNDDKLLMKFMVD